MTNLIGQTLGQYQITALLGKGGMATVYRARQTSMDRDVAVKIIKPELSDSEEFRARFNREAQVIARLSHPHIPESLRLRTAGRSGLSGDGAA
jgi:serine/threonine protein kinase